MEVKPDRHNWRQFCQEPRISDEEWARWRQMAVAMRADGALFDFINGATQKEREALREAERQGGWEGLVAEVDAHRRLMRAELKAWRGYENCPA